MTEPIRRPLVALSDTLGSAETTERLLAAVASSRGGELRLARHHLDALETDVTVVVTIDPVTDDLIVRLA